MPTRLRTPWPVVAAVFVLAVSAVGCGSETEEPDVEEPSAADADEPEEPEPQADAPPEDADATDDSDPADDEDSQEDEAPPQDDPSQQDDSPPQQDDSPPTNGGSGTGNSASPPDVVTEDHDGETIALPQEGFVRLQLSSDWVWDEPEVDGTSIELIRVDYLADPGFQEWEVQVLAPGVSNVSTRGYPNCEVAANCRERDVELRFEVVG